MLPHQDQFIEKLYRENFEKLTVYANSKVGRIGKAQEIVQDTFHEAVKKVDTLMKHENPGGWLMTTVKNKVKESERLYQRDIQFVYSLSSGVYPGPAAAKNARIDLSSEEAVLVIEKIRAALKPDEFRLLVRLRLEKKSHLEVAEEFHISISACQKRLQRIRTKLLKKFPEWKIFLRH